MKRNLLLVDDERTVRMALRRTLASPDFGVLEASGALEALRVLALTPVQVVISDQHMRGETGTSLLAEIEAHYPHIVRILLTADTSKDVFTAAIGDANVRRVIYKPWDDEQLRAIVRQAFGLRRPVPSRSPGRYDGAPTVPRLARVR